MEKIRISAVRYANTYPFIYGLSKSNFDKKAIIETDHPTDCAAKLISGRADIGLIPVAAIPLLKESAVISDFCIGANGKVRTVQLMSNNGFDDINKVFLDYRSGTSVKLAQVLAKNKWKSEFKWIATTEGFDFVHIKQNEAVVLIGDQCFEYEKHFRFKYDLAAEWKDFSGLPFVFACWVSNRTIPVSFIKDFNKALESGVKNIDRVVKMFSKTGPIRDQDLYEYLTVNIDYDFNTEKRKAMRYFLELIEDL